MCTVITFDSLPVTGADIVYRKSGINLTGNHNCDVKEMLGNFTIIKFSIVQFPVWEGCKKVVNNYARH